jgi:hypothetical protein
MGSTSETGHAKIVANFDRLLGSLSKLGKDYSPSNPALLIEALLNTSANSKKALDSVGTAALMYRSAVKAREAVPKPRFRPAPLVNVPAGGLSGPTARIARGVDTRRGARSCPAPRTHRSG